MRLRSGVFVVAAFVCYGLTLLSPKGASINYALILLGIGLALLGLFFLVKDGVEEATQRRIKEIEKQFGGQE